jgi:hypothetical protein
MFFRSKFCVFPLFLSMLANQNGHLQPGFVSNVSPQLIENQRHQSMNGSEEEGQTQNTQQNERTQQNISI